MCWTREITTQMLVVTFISMFSSCELRYPIIRNLFCFSGAACCCNHDYFHTDKYLSKLIFNIQSVRQKREQSYFRCIFHNLRGGSQATAAESWADANEEKMIGEDSLMKTTDLKANFAPNQIDTTANYVDDTKAFAEADEKYSNEAMNEEQDHPRKRFVLRQTEDIRSSRSDVSHDDVQGALESLFNSGRCKREDIDDRCLDFIRSCQPPRLAAEAIRKFEYTVGLRTVRQPSSFLMRVLANSLRNYRRGTGFPSGRGGAGRGGPVHKERSAPRSPSRPDPPRPFRGGGWRAGWAGEDRWAKSSGREACAETWASRTGRAQVRRESEEQGLVAGLGRLVGRNRDPGGDRDLRV